MPPASSLPCLYAPSLHHLRWGEQEEEEKSRSPSTVKSNSDQGFPCMGWRKAGCLLSSVVAWMFLFPGHLLETAEEESKWVSRLTV